jgi:hypothetical protein
LICRQIPSRSRKIRSMTSRFCPGGFAMAGRYHSVTNRVINQD